MKMAWTLLLLITAVAMDVRKGRISNRLICLGTISGILIRIWESGIEGLILSVIQIFIPVIVLFLLFLMRALGAGDIKLFSLIGSIWNLKVLCSCMFFSFLAGAVMSLAKLLYHKNLLVRLNYFCRYIRECFLIKSIGVYRRQSDGKENTICFSMAVFVGFCITMEVTM